LLEAVLHGAEAVGVDVDLLQLILVVQQIVYVQQLRCRQQVRGHVVRDLLKALQKAQALAQGTVHSLRGLLEHGVLLSAETLAVFSDLGCFHTFFLQFTFVLIELGVDLLC
jgi:hypothetical protein